VPSNIYDRRKFLKMVGVAGCAPLIGTSTAFGFSQPTHATSIKGSAKSVLVPTHEWTGDFNERLDFPRDWELEVMEMKGATTPVLTSQQIGNRLDQPIGTLPLQGIAAGESRMVAAARHKHDRLLAVPDPQHDQQLFAADAVCHEVG
jgi:hypothetical protein